MTGSDFVFWRWDQIEIPSDIKFPLLCTMYVAVCCHIPTSYRKAFGLLCWTSLPLQYISNFVLQNNRRILNRLNLVGPCIIRNTYICIKTWNSSVRQLTTVYNLRLKITNALLIYILKFDLICFCLFCFYRWVIRKTRLLPNF